MMRKYFKYLASLFLVPLTRWYLRKERTYSYKGIKITVKPGVFHPGLFYSTKFLLEYLESKNLGSKTFLELGCGSGLISIYAAKYNAIVTASDISKLAADTTKVNAERNHANVNVVESDLFNSIRQQIFDWIVINPPYYANDPKTEAEFAWHCGKNFEYFENLFTQLPDYYDGNTQSIMVLTKGCDLNAITAIALKHNYRLELLAEKEVLFDEKDFLYQIVRKN